MNVKQRQLLPVTSFESLTGRGAKAVIDGQLYYVSNDRKVEELGICGPHVEEVLRRLEEEGKTAVVLSTENAPLCVIGVADTVREHSTEAIRRLHALGVASVMLTGDNQTTASAIAAQVGIDDARGNLLPEDKLAVIDDLIRRYGKVGMVGDGINDAPALAAADVGVAVGGANDIATAAADIALLHGGITGLPTAFALARRTLRTIRENLFWAFVYNVLGIPVAAGALYAISGWQLSPVFASAAMSLSSVSVLANSLRLRRFGRGGV